MLYNDHTYISAFRQNNQKAMTTFYDANQRSFIKSIGAKFHILNSDLLQDVYQDSFCRLWENIQRNKLTESSLTTSLPAYLYGIGEFVMYEYLRKQKESLVTDEQMNDYANELELNGLKEYEQLEQYEVIKETVNQMGKPCAPLLLKFYWEELSWDTIAIQLGYSNANSAKTQKNKCMNKLKKLFR